MPFIIQAQMIFQPYIHSMDGSTPYETSWCFQTVPVLKRENAHSKADSFIFLTTKSVIL